MASSFLMETAREKRWDGSRRQHRRLPAPSLLRPARRRVKRSIGGALTLDAMAALTGRDRHRPQSRDEMRLAVSEMASRGMTDHTIAAATGLSAETVRRLLGETQ